ncbi:TIGR02757 family protein [Parapedobacter sp. 10938]|uniref:TIGR02757 family protein n=1 Tax=Parapedobacter flavus TaxID=3110225 RepID=UPI002DBA27C9|nr:TIGR02757 family protein [Parapedobacter sp. 10938]MEC3880341.1 TIGR02757 family protein [Parapedobacter sp. 10938]
MNKEEVSLKDFLDRKVDEYNRVGFIDNDPVCIPHRFTRKQDIEIMGFFAAVLAWGQRKTIINKCTELIDRMDGVPYDFVKNHEESDLRQLEGFKHRTFNDTDLLYFIRFFHEHYHLNHSLEAAFVPPASQPEFRSEYMDGAGAGTGDAMLSSPACYLGALNGTGNQPDVASALNHFRTYFFRLPDYPMRTRKHISSPASNSACKRLNMFLRWMVRQDDRGVDFGLWRQLAPADLICPCDVHVERVARKLGLIERKQSDWKTACELTDNLRLLDANDPVKYDFALFGLGVEGEL